MGLSPFLLRTGKCESFQSEKFMRDCRFLEAELQDLDRVLAGRSTRHMNKVSNPRDEPLHIRKVFRSDEGHWVAEPGIDRKASAFIAKFHAARMSESEQQRPNASVHC